MLSINDLRIGTIIEMGGQPYIVVFSQHSKQARGGAVMRTKLKNILTGQVKEETFQGNDRIQEADISRGKAQYLYNSGGEYYFMNNNSYEQFNLGEDILGDQSSYLVEGMEVDVLNFNNQPVSVELPNSLPLKVVEAEPGLRGDTASGGTKKAKLETGIIIQVPLFIEEGDIVRVDTRDGRYLERLK